MIQNPLKSSLKKGKYQIDINSVFQFPLFVYQFRRLDKYFNHNTFNYEIVKLK